MRLNIEHQTIFSYDKPVREAVGEARLRPRGDAGQYVSQFRLTLDPATPFDTIADRFGNALECYSVLAPHRRLAITASSVVDTSPNPLIATPGLTLLQQHEFGSPSPYVPLTDELMAFAQTHAPASDDPEQVAQAFMSAIRATCAYEPGSTSISTTAAAVLAGQRGVCQDFAHLMIALCRSINIPARYISGYLYDPALPPEAVVASHAWVEVFLANRGWMGFDPTHNRPTSARYVRVALGRDYADAAPVRGLYQGPGEEKLTVRVQIRADDDQPGKGK